ncbi:uncharacterized protein LOC120680525 [Panicum virgatum]|uniref:Uncharacterized protein n=1 Tax=Panicum virgatum TaxID=38727 RepID=A0A8T0PTB0_PANVG|nr:uncharacterized protein LOC120680525 [Panicum virgatum]KAG2565661.1 hypothetical protein PVAP13_7NG118317 [Panicum virgatum]
MISCLRSTLVSSDEHLVQIIGADTIDDAAEEILKALKEDTDTTRTASSRNNVIYFDGWNGLGASAVLRAVARRLAASATSPVGLEFEQVIHIDCSKWESRRALQRAVAEQLELPVEVMEMFDKQDEDDFLGVKKDSRAEVQQVGREMHRHVQKMDRRFLVILHNGSNEEIDLASLCGFPLTGYSTNKVLWTFQGRFRLKPRMKVDKAMHSAGTTDVFISMAPSREEQEEVWRYLLHQDTEELLAACKIDIASYGIIHQPTQVAECLLYMLELCSRGSQGTHYDLSTHGGNYWVCDGIIRRWLQHGERDVSAADDDDDVLWRAAVALQHEMPLDVDYYQHLSSSHLARYVKSKPYWSSPAYGFTRVPDGVIPDGVPALL